MKQLFYIVIAAVLFVGCHKVLNPIRTSDHPQIETQQDRYENLNPWEDISKYEDVLGVYINGQKTLSQLGNYYSTFKVSKSLDCRVWDSVLTISADIYESAYWQGSMIIELPLEGFALYRYLPAKVSRGYYPNAETMTTASVFIDSILKDKREIIGRFKFEGVTQGVAVEGKKGIFNAITDESTINSLYQAMSNQ